MMIGMDTTPKHFTWNSKCSELYQRAQSLQFDTTLYLKYVPDSDYSNSLSKHFRILGLRETSQDFFARMVLRMHMSALLRSYRIWDFHFRREMFPMFERICHPLSDFVKFIKYPEWERDFVTAFDWSSGKLKVTMPEQCRILSDIFA